MPEIQYSIDIAASAARVWEILTDFPAYPSWNPFIRSISGAQTAGSRLNVRIQPEGGRAMAISPTLLNFSPSKEFRWKGQLLFPGIFDGEHYFQIYERSPGSVSLTHGEIFGGFLVPLVFRGALRIGTEFGFQAMNRALKLRAEGRKFFRCFIHGKNFPGAMLSLPYDVGFYTTRHIEAVDAEAAEMAVLEMLRKDPALQIPPGLEKSVDARVYFEKIEEIPGDITQASNSGFTFYEMTPDEELAQTAK